MMFIIRIFRVIKTAHIGVHFWLLHIEGHSNDDSA